MGSSAPGVEVITGSMFSGKTDELIRRLRRARIARQEVQVFKPSLDTRYAAGKVMSHAGSEFEATPVERAAMITALVHPRPDDRDARRPCVVGATKRRAHP